MTKPVNTESREALCAAVALLLLLGLIPGASPAWADQERQQQKEEQKGADDERETPDSRALEGKACGPDGVNYSTSTDKKQHPTSEAPPDKALIYVIRPTKAGNKIQTRLGVDGTWVGVNRGNNYFSFALDPGEHYFCSQAENRSVLALTVEAGRTYYLQQKIRMGVFKARNRLELLDEAEGKAGLAKTHPSSWQEKE